MIDAKIQEQAAVAVYQPVDFDEIDPLDTSFTEKLPAIFLIMLAILWLGAVGVIVAGGGLAEPGWLTDAVNWTALASGPLALAGIAYMLLRRTSRREAKRYLTTAGAMRVESENLERALAQLSLRISENRRDLSRQAEQLLSLGGESADSLARITDAMRAETAALTESSAALGLAAATARDDMAVLLADLPRAEAQTRDMAELIRATGVSAQERAAGLEAQLTALAARGREADESAGGAAERLAAHLSQIEATSDAAGRRLEEASVDMSRAVDSALDKAAQAIDETRQGMSAQSAAMIAMIEEGRAALERTGAESTAALAHRLEEIGERVDSFAARLAAQDAASQALVGSLDKALGAIEQRLAALGESGVDQTTGLAEAVATLSGNIESIGGALGAGSAATDALVERAASLRALISACAREMGETLPAAIIRMERQAAHSHTAIAAVAPRAAEIAEATAAAAARLIEAGEMLDRQRAGFETLGEDAVARVAALRQQTEALDTLILATSSDAHSLTEGASSQLVEALLRVREAATQAADGARDTLAGVIPGAAESLAKASAEAMDQAITGKVESQMASIAEAAEAAVATAKKASERLMRQMLTIADTTSSIEARIAEAKEEVEQHDRDSFGRRVALLIESLNSAAIDVTKILSNDVTDTAWAAYLRGDRGVFTRRAVRLLDTPEAREIARHYETEPEFREQVNRYIHDFEAMLRRILSSRDGTPLGVTILSSDMGKLYVALAQAIERLRR